MKKKRLPYKWLIFFLLTGSISNAQTFTTRLYTTADGLSDNYIFSIYQDTNGYLWIGTANGLNRFDGKQFVNFGLKQGLPSRFVDRVYEDRHHRLWIGTRGGIAELKGDSCYVVPYEKNKDVYFISSFFEPDSTRLWATTDQGVFELQGNKWVKISLCKGYEKESVGKIIRNGNDLLINYSNDKLVQLKPNGDTSMLFSIHSDHPYYNSLYNFNDTIYFGTYHSLVHRENNKWVTSFTDTLAKKYIYISYRDQENRWWFGTRQDGILIATTNNNNVRYQRIPLSFNLVSAFFEDREHNIWVAGFRGLLKVSNSYYNSIPLKKNNDLGEIRNFMFLPAGKVLLSGDKGRLLIVDTSSGKQSLPPVNLSLKDKNDFIDYGTFDDKQRLWFTTRNGELYQLDGLRLSNKSSIIISKLNNYLKDIVYNRVNHRFYLAGDSVLFSGTENRLDTFFDARKKTIPFPYKIYSNDQTGFILLQTMDDSSFEIGPDETVYKPSKNIPLNLGVSVYDSVLNKYVIWSITNGKNIIAYDWDHTKGIREEQSITQKDGLTEYSVWDFAMDGNDRCWIATTKGITLMQKNNGQWMHQDFEIGESGIPQPLSFTRIKNDNRGHIWANTADKLIFFDTKRTVVESQHTNTIIEKVLLYGQPTEWSLYTDSLKGYSRLPVDPVLSHDQNTLNIVFNGLQYHTNALIEYSYRLLPSDTTWSNPLTGNIVSFYELQSGQYQFEVKSRIVGFDWSDAALFSFTIKKSFWETWWFRLLTILVASALIFFIFRYRLKQLKAKTVIQNQLLELEMKALKLQMNPHFVHNALNSIQSLIINNRSTEASHYINKFARLLRQVFENADKNLVSLSNELYSLQLYVDLEQLRMNMDINYSVQMDEDAADPSLKIPPLILQPFVENALWHGLSTKEGDKTIIVNITTTDKWIICEITDNGIGRKKAAESYQAFPEGHLSKAVQIIDQRLAGYNQSTESEPVSFTDLADDNGPAGTAVTIRIRR